MTVALEHYTTTALEATIFIRNVRVRPKIVNEEERSATKAKEQIVTPFFFKSPSQGAATSLLCATTADPKDSGKYFDNCKPTEALAKVEQEAGSDAAGKLWKQTEAVLKGLGF